MTARGPPTSYHPVMRTRLLVGLTLWRGGLLLSGGWSAYRLARYLLQFLDLPLAIEIGTSLVLAGLVLVLASVILENLDDRKAAET